MKGQTPSTDANLQGRVQHISSDDILATLVLLCTVLQEIQSSQNHERAAAFLYVLPVLPNLSHLITCSPWLSLLPLFRGSVQFIPPHPKPSPRLALLLLSHGLELLLPLQLSQPLSQLHRLELSFVEGVERVPLLPPQLQNLKSEDANKGPRIQGIWVTSTSIDFRAHSGVGFRVQG